MLTSISFLSQLADAPIRDAALAYTELNRRALALRNPAQLSRAAACKTDDGVFAAAAPIASWQLPWLMGPTDRPPQGYVTALVRNRTILLNHLPRTSGAGVLLASVWCRMVSSASSRAWERDTPCQTAAPLHDALWTVAQRVSSDLRLEPRDDGMTWAHDLARVVELASLTPAGRVQIDDVRQALSECYALVSADLTTIGTTH